MTAPDQEKQADDSINLEYISRILLRIVAQLPKSEYSESIQQYRQQVEEVELNDLSDPASDLNTSQG
ncbi:MAG: hypothetical protein Phog2KO_39330 [Phototrophicaceae bacterium]